MQIGAAHHGLLQIDLGALRQNYQLLNSKTADMCETAAVVKANAYGLGVAPISKALYEAGARSFFVASLEEGLELRTVLPDVRIFILNGFCMAQGAAYKHYNLVPVLNTIAEIKSYNDMADSQLLPAIIHIDTAMNRLGLSADDVAYLKDKHEYMSGLDILFVMSHFTSSEVYDHPSNRVQRERFDEYSAVFGIAKKSLCNSGGIFLGRDYHYDLIRPGIALYGGHPSDSLPVNPMSQLVELSVPVLQIRHAEKGQSAGYNETYRFPEKSMLAVVSLGYADGVLRSLSNAGSLYYRGYELPIRGRVSMDLIICDLSNMPAQMYPREGDMLELLGRHQTIDDVARAAGTISYEVLTSLGQRYHRSYIG